MASTDGPDPNADLPTQRLPTGQPALPEVAGPQAGLAGPLVLGDRYELLGELGRGGMGVVYRARDKNLGRDVALKVLQLTGRVDDEAIERFQREARAAAALDHPNIVRVHDVGKLPSGSPFYTMEMLVGQDLAHAIMDDRISPKQAVEAVRQVSLALFYAHQKGILHRDLKPQNIFLRQQAGLARSDPALDTKAGLPAGVGEVHALLLDFGLAKLAESDLSAHADQQAGSARGSQGRKSMQNLTRSGEIFGTPAYMPPEQTRGARDVDARADIYSLGAAFYHAIAGRPPFDAGSLAELLVKVQRQDAVAPSVHNRGLDADLDTIALKCLQKEPQDRYQNAGDLAEDLKRWLAGDPISARPIGTIGRVWRRAKRNKPVAILVATLVLSALSAVTWFGGGAAVRAWRLAGCETEYDRAMAAKDFERAASEADRARDLAPNDARWRERKETARYEKSAVLGRVQLTLWRTHRDESARLERAAKEKSATSPTAGKTPSAAERDSRRAERWNAEEAMSAEALAREDAWSKASVAFTEAITHRTMKEAEDALTELYWDRYLRAEQVRDRAAMSAYESYVVQFGKEKYERELRGRREIFVRFWLPIGYAGQQVEAYLCEYRRCKWPPVFVPVPYDMAHGRPVQEVVERLAEDDAGWKPVPLSATEGAGGASPIVAAARSKSLFEPRCLDESRVRLAVGREGSRSYAEFKPQLPRGSYVLDFPAGEGLFATRYPFEVAREFPWKEACELPAGPDHPPLLPGMDEGMARPYWVYVPAGPYRASGDPEAQQSPSRDPVVLRLPEEKPLSDVGPARSLQGYYIARFEVTALMYLAFLNDREWHQRCVPKCGDWGHVPRKAPGAKAETSYWPRDPSSGRFSHPPGWEGLPIIAVSFNDATNYCTWLTERQGGGTWVFALPSEDEWEKAARGPDGRYHPWGDSFDDTFCAMVDSRPGEQETRNPEPYGLFPVDEGPCGVRDVGGGVFEWTRTECGGGFRIAKGGAWGTQAAFCRCAYRYGFNPEIVNSASGLRVVARRTP